MSKELTTFVIDVSESMDEAFEDALAFFRHSVISKMIKGRVTDFISVITFHSSETNHIFQHEDDPDALKGVNLITRKKAPTLGDLKMYERDIKPVDTQQGELAGAIEALSLAVALMAEDAKGAFIKNIVLISDFRSVDGADSDERLRDATKNAVANSGINVTIIDAASSDPESRPGTDNWYNMAEDSPMFTFVNSVSVLSVLESSPPLKRVDPRSMFRGNLRFAANPDTEGFDENAVCVDIEVFPAVKTEKLPSMKNYLVDDGIKDLTSAYNYYVETEDTGDKDKKEDKLVVQKGDWENGYRFTNKDIHVIDSEAIDATKLPTKPSVDVIGSIGINDLPTAFFTEDSMYTVPTKMSGSRNLISYNALCQSLVNTKDALLVRYVQKPNDEVKLCAMVPCKAKIEDSYVFAMQMVRLPFKEDEKIGRFPKLVEGQPDDFETGMDRFLTGMDLDEGNTSENPFLITNEKVAMTTHQTLADKVYLSENDNITVTDRLMSQNPAINKFNKNLFKLIQKAAQAEDLEEFINDPDFINKYMVIEGQTNLFNLKNVLNNPYVTGVDENGNDKSQWLTGKAKGIKKISKRLATRTKPFKPIDKKRRIKKNEDTNNYGEEQLEVIDIDALFE